MISIVPSRYGSLEWSFEKIRRLCFGSLYQACQTPGWQGTCLGWLPAAGRVFDMLATQLLGRYTTIQIFKFLNKNT